MQTIDLARRSQAGDGDAFTQLAAMMADQAFAVAYRITRNTGSAEDATQHALLTAWRRLPMLREPERFEAWFYRILVNACRDELRRDRAWRGRIELVKPLPTSAGAPAEPQRDGAMSISVRDQIDRAFARLSPDHRIVVVLRHYLGWSTAEIAAALSLPGGTVSSRLHYGLSALRAAIEADERVVHEESARVRA